MECFTCVAGLGAALPGANIDTDVIMPKAFLKGIDRSGLARGLFHDLRFDEQGEFRTEFVLNRPDAQGVRFLVVGPNFGCGSSREHAVWGMLQYGVRAVIGTSFAGIFADNAANNGLLLVTLPSEELLMLMEYVGNEPAELTVDLEQRQIRGNGLKTAFEIDAARRRALVLGLDRIGETLSHANAIRTWEAERLQSNPWLTAGEVA
ncbi:3-isopropylmalate dehydratase small subunit [Acetobacter nitrogenifigens DSM 23921 = NBRC 105050]|uniref:3-isopropylmalate dehydratase small subunit n=1 Tax=Acetobacter nitrogenifigens DSM 23921 = NBRC 105050 TaxID=1120919 RepID=A0A511XCJ7_9PROT|nr:3-isopropylmalate dehydratase small subunit [Acetobacter nitrogenifigens]GBQ87688.1 3-isopropylmalate dehydratase small subunit [Acetobacter nitrogenifigens DSM 23921 = NBRC 105050]GEN60660.1 3-isopropylmalate dehydratase small subunit [Acetobacter nitrogenifigens DSM 23921 = NBRC 105050]